MAKRQTIESKVVQYFRSADLAQAELVFGLVAGEMKARRADVRAVEGASKPVRKTRKARKANTQSGAVAFEPAVLAQ